MKKNKEIVYFFRQKGTNNVKIGMTASEDCQSRFTSFCTYSPTGGEIIGTIKCKNARILEKEIHSMFSHKRLKGEFFNLTKEECITVINRNDNDTMSDILTDLEIIGSSCDADNLLSKIRSFIKNLKIYNNESLAGDVYGLDGIVLSLFQSSGTNRMTATQVAELLKESGHEASSVGCGMALSKFFVKKRVKSKGNVVTVYMIDKIQK